MTDTISVNGIGPFTDAPNQASPATGDAFLIDRGGVIQHVLEEDLKSAIVGTPASTDGSFQERIEGTTDGIADTFSFVTTTPASADYVDIFIDGRLRRDFTLDGQSVVFDSPPIGGETYVLVHWQTVGGSGGGVTDHGALIGLGDDDHSQYHNDARGDARYYTETELDAGQLDGRYYTETEVDASFAALGTAAAENVGTAVGDVPQLEDVGGGTPGLPAVDGSQLTGLAGGGDMVAATYDPQAIAGDAFDTDNHTSGTTNKVYTATEQTKLAAIGSRLTGTGTPANSIVAGSDLDVTITVTGAAVATHAVALVHSTVNVAGLILTSAWVSATNTVTLKYTNYGEAAAALSGTKTVKVEAI